MKVLYRNRFEICATVLLAGMLLSMSGCKTQPTLEERKHERWLSYASLPQEQRQWVDEGQIRVGMSEDAVYISWGQPDEELQSEDPSGLRTIWRYHGAWAKETQYWTYQEVSRNGRTHLERRMVREYDPGSYVRAELIFIKGKLALWQTLPRPLN